MDEPTMIRLYLYENGFVTRIPEEVMDLPPEEAFERAMHWINQPGHPYRTWMVGPACTCGVTPLADCPVHNP